MEGSRQLGFFLFLVFSLQLAWPPHSLACSTTPGTVMRPPQIGVSDADARQRILGAVLNVHKQEWKMLSHTTLYTS